MAFSSFIRSNRPAAEIPEEEEEEEEQPMLRSGSVRAFSHLPVREEERVDAPIVPGNEGSTRQYIPMPMHEDAVEDWGMLPRSGGVRASSHLPAREEEDADAMPESGHGQQGFGLPVAGSASGPLSLRGAQPTGRWRQLGGLAEQENGRQFDRVTSEPHAPSGGGEPPPGFGWRADDQRQGIRGPGAESTGDRFASDQGKPPMSRLFEKRNRDGTAPSSRGIPQSGGLGFDDLVYRGQAPGAGNGGAGSFTNADAMPGVRLQQLAAAAGSQEQQVRGAAVHAQGGRLGAQQAAAPKSSIPSTPPNPTSAAEKRSFSSPRRVSGDRPLGYKKPKPQPPKEPALIQNDKVIQASSVSPSKRGLAVLREFFNPDATDLNQLYDSMRKRLADGEALVLLINSNGAHAAIITFYLDEEGNLVSTLFDPGGEYKHGGVRGSDGVFTNTIPKQGPNETRWSLAEYIEFHSKDGAMSFVPVWTDAKTAQDFQYPQGTSGGFCAKASCAVLVQIPGITHRGGPGPFFPSALSDRLYKLMGRRVTIKH